MVEHRGPRAAAKALARSALASMLVELWADEWFALLTLHWRWNVPANADWAIGEFSRCSFPWLPEWLGRRLVTPVAESMQKYRPVVGITEQTIPGIEHFTRALITALEQHLEQPETPFLFGGRPSRGDMALSAPLWAHLWRDPHSRFLFDSAPHCVRWMQSMHGDEQGRGWDSVAAEASWLPEDQIEASSDAIFKLMFSEQWPFLRQVIDAVDAYLDANPTASRVPRVVGSGNGKAGW